MSKELHLSAKDYSNLAIMITVGELLFQLPGTMLLKKIGPSYQVSGDMLPVIFNAIVMTSYSSAGQ